MQCFHPSPCRYDTNNDGVISVAEFDHGVARLGLSNGNRLLGLDPEQQVGLGRGSLCRRKRWAVSPVQCA
jgi:hypothetical protein